MYVHFGGSPNYLDRDDTDFHVLTKLSTDEVKGSDWDPNSIIHYEFEDTLIKSDWSGTLLLDVADGDQKNFIIQPKNTGKYEMAVHGQDIVTVKVLSESISGDDGPPRHTEYVSADDNSALEEISFVQAELVAEREYVLSARVVSNHGGRDATVIVRELPAGQKSE